MVHLFQLLLLGWLANVMKRERQLALLMGVVNFCFQAYFLENTGLRLGLLFPDFVVCNNLFMFDAVLCNEDEWKKNHVGKLSYLLFACVGMCKYVT